MKEKLLKLPTWQKLLLVVFILACISRICSDPPPTPEELAAQKAIRAAKKQKQDSINFASKKAEMLAWRKENPKAAKIYDKHPKWTMEECKMISEGMVWIGMTYDMLKYMRGLPDSANPSNYGSGTRWQWCWHDKTPSCFYDNNDDGIIDSFN